MIDQIVLQLQQRLKQQITPTKVQSFRLPILEQDIVSSTPASVLVAVQHHGIFHAPKQWSILLTERADHLRDHAGQISFVGGRREPDDINSAATAMREAYEEVGLSSHNVKLVGKLHQHLVGRSYLVTPHLALINAFQERIDSNEVKKVFYLPLSFLLDDNNCLPDHRFPDYHGHQFQFEGHNIWGGTASILLDLKHIIKNVKIFF